MTAISEERGPNPRSYSVPHVRRARRFGIWVAMVLLVTLSGGPQETVARADRADGSPQARRRALAGLSGGSQAAREQVLEGTEADDVLDGGAGRDWIYGEDGNDLLRGLDGDDMLDGGPGDDTLEGGEGGDVGGGGEGNDRLLGQGGDDILDGGDGLDYLEGGPGRDDLSGGDQSDVLLGGAGEDILDGGDDEDFLDGGDDADHLAGRDNADTLLGGAGDDLLLGGDADDVLSGGLGVDRIEGGIGDDILRGGNDDDTLLAGAGDDAVFGDGHDDHLQGGLGKDVLSGGAGDDFLHAGPDADVSRGGEGHDRFVLRAGDVPAGSEETIQGEEGTDALVLSGFPAGAWPNGPEVEKEVITLEDPATGGIYRVVSVEGAIHRHHLVVASARSLGISGEASADAPQLPASLLLVNPGSSPVDAELLLSDADGSPIGLADESEPETEQRVEDAAGAGEQPADAPETMTVTIPGRGSVEAALSRWLEPAGSTVGVRVEAAERLAVLGAVASPGARWRSEMPVVDNFYVPLRIDAGQGIDTGATLLNLGPRTVVKFDLLVGPGGTEIDSRERELEAGAHVTVWASELFPERESLTGALRVESSDVAAHGLRRRIGGGTDVIPVLPTQVPHSAGPATPPAPALSLEPLYFPILGLDGTAATLFVLNPSTEPLEGRLEFFGRDGEARSLEVEGLGDVRAVALELGPGLFVRHRVRDRDGNPEVSARIRWTAGSVEVLVYGPAPGGGLFALAGVRPSTDFLIALPGVASPVGSTSVAMLAGDRGTSVSLELMDAQGNLVDGGTAELALPAAGARLQPLEMIFPEAELEGLNGSLRAVAREGAFVILILRATGDGFKELPTIPLQ